MYIYIFSCIYVLIYLKITKCMYQYIIYSKHIYIYIHMLYVCVNSWDRQHHRTPTTASKRHTCRAA